MHWIQAHDGNNTWQQRMMSQHDYIYCTHAENWFNSVSLGWLAWSLTGAARLDCSNSKFCYVRSTVLRGRKIALRYWTIARLLHCRPMTFIQHCCALDKSCEVEQISVVSATLFAPPSTDLIARTTDRLTAQIRRSCIFINRPDLIYIVKQCRH